MNLHLSELLFAFPSVPLVNLTVLCSSFTVTKLINDICSCFIFNVCFSFALCFAQSACDFKAPFPIFPRSMPLQQRMHLALCKDDGCFPSHPENLGSENQMELKLGCHSVTLYNYPQNKGIGSAVA